MKRRTFISTGAAALPTLARPAIQRGPESRFLMGLAAYSFRGYFATMRGKPQPAAADGRSMDMRGFIDFCATQNCGAELTSYFFPPDADAAWYRELRRYAFVRGVPIAGTAIGNNFSLPAGAGLDKQVADAKAWIDRSVYFGAPHIRFFAGTAKHLAQDPERIKTSIAALQECAEYAGERGIMIGVENHGNISPDQLVEIIEGVDSPWIGINLDTGNFHTEDPYADLARSAPWAVNIQVKLEMRSPQGVHSAADYGRIAQILREARYQGFVVLEYEAKAPFAEVPGEMAKLRKALFA
ncbi:MAG: sugar phosphate isomerase/epimerase [Rhodothermales bacterium]|jgi:sugar phosphate isomerase/epimerase